MDYETIIGVEMKALEERGQQLVADLTAAKNFIAQKEREVAEINGAYAALEKLKKQFTDVETPKTSDAEK